jgi:hypothetical protein
MKEWDIRVTKDLEESLTKDFMLGQIINDQGLRFLTEEKVATLNGLKIQIFSNEHPPPHFRVKYAGETANFTIKDCTKINGGLNKWERNIRYWHASNKQNLINVWNNTRPSDCPVGVYRE